MDEPTDDELLARSLLRPQAFGLLYERHSAAVFRYLARRAGADAAEDLVGDVFVVALEARVRYHPHASGSALPWLYGIGGNVVRAHLRRQRPSATIDREVGVDWDAVDDRLDARAARGELRRALSSLTPSEREAFLLVAWEGLSPAEAARALGVTPTVVRTRLNRARQRARTVLNVAPLPAV
ncbi:sigma-70 family RNA polymerase sigma factor [Cellulomonas hominis]|uniref:RNA polymerase sigma factor n=1 Tax=Cellulomonas hominis TaxID=156981 RepID=UPI001C1019BB|nr:sigma-70 family RNA polymerase sigma factor [Cellulomonas hominis]MBU5422555.1 sigma-70 family RNA polymerase sigma factor [Cellulomonas hominis]